MNKSALEQLKNFSTVVADTSDLGNIRKFRPKDATTNPSLILKAAQDPQYHEILDKTIFDNKSQPIKTIIDNIIVNFGTAILQLIDGRVSSEVDARYSFDVKQTVECARNIIDLYQKKNIPPKNVLIKIAATWEGIRAAKILESEGIHCNLTLIFSLEQAVACANNSVTLISPFVGRILDWYKKNKPEVDHDRRDPGVKSVSEIFNYYKTHGYDTEIMGASFRNIDEIISLAGCDLLTISPTLLDQLSQTSEIVTRKLDPMRLGATSYNNEDELSALGKLNDTEPIFRFRLNENTMATEKLAEGIRLFVRDTRQLENIVRTKLSEMNA